MFRGRKLNLGPALKKKTTNRFPTGMQNSKSVTSFIEYAVATPTGLLQPGMFGYGYVTQPYMMPHPQVLFLYVLCSSFDSSCTMDLFLMAIR